jgi:hypothetical protein
MPTTFKQSYATRALDARPDRLDLRDRMYAPKLASLPPAYPPPRSVPGLIARYVKAGMILDQENEGACTGFGLAAVVNYLAWHANGAPARGVPLASTRMLYHLAQYYDEWPGEDYSGSSCRGALKGWHRHGVCREDLWPYRDAKGRAQFVAPRRGWETDALSRPLGVYFRIDRQSVVDMQSAICEIGAIFVSAQAHDGWDRVPAGRTLPVIPPPKGVRRAGHAFAIVGYEARGFIVQNSWGPGWGRSGFAILAYEDWIENGTDAWSVALGVPRRDAVPRVAFATRRLALPSDGPQPRGLATDSVANRAGDGRVSHDAAYLRTIVMDNDGRPVNTLVASPDAVHAVRHVVVEEARRFFASQPKTAVRKVMVWAHGGLVDEAASIERVRTVAPQVERLGVYPLFLTWKTGVLETLRQQLEDERRAIPDDRLEPPAGAGGALLRRFKEWVADTVDRLLEVAARNVLIRVLWNQMKQNAEAAATTGGGTLLMADGLVELAQAVAAQNEKLEIHFVGHSAGAIAGGFVLDALNSRGLTTDSMTLYAPACTVAFANARIAPFFGGARRKDLRIWTLSDDLERDDSVGPYNKSILYLVSRALEEFHKMPLLGLARAYEPFRASDTIWNTEDGFRDRVAADLAAWQGFFGGAPDLVTTKQVSNGVEAVDADHGSFDNNVVVVADTLTRISGKTVKPEDLRLDFGGS